MQTQLKELTDMDEDVEFFSNADLGCLSSLVEEFEIDSYSGQEITTRISFNSINHLNSSITFITSPDEIAPFTEYDYEDIIEKFKNGIAQEFVVEPMKVQEMMYYIFGILVNSRECSNMIMDMDILINHDTDELSIFIDYDEDGGMVDKKKLSNLGLDDFFADEDYLKIKNLSENDPNSIVEMNDFDYVYVDEMNIVSKILKTLCTHQDEIAREFSTGKYFSTHQVMMEYQDS